MKSVLEKNREYAEKFIQSIFNPKVPEEIRAILINNNIKNFIDLGCGDGALIHALNKEFPKLKVHGVDISPRRIKGLSGKFPHYKFYCKDVCNTGLKKNSFDFVHSSQVLEHVENDKKMVAEMYRILKNRGFLFVSSVVKKPFAIYKYRNKGGFVLDPTHEREYKNEKEFLELFREKFRLIKIWILPVKRKKLFTFQIPGYYLIHGIWKKRK